MLQPCHKAVVKRDYLTGERPCRTRRHIGTHSRKAPLKVVLRGTAIDMFKSMIVGSG